MTFNIFGPATKEDIRVGYISTDRGYIADITVCEANDYAKSNPGTTFIFRTRKVTQYLNINEVNKLTPNDLDSEIATCGGVELDAECGGPLVIFMGGGGIGAKGNPIIGTDGSVLGVDLVSGGYGYQYPPLVEIKDPCGIGAGTVAEASLGEIIETVQTYGDEEDFEHYEICDEDVIGFGKQYDAEGKVIGNWDPYMYTNYTESPFEKEISDYQKQLRQFKKPFWNTRQEPPLKITSPGKTTKTKYDVKDSRWGEFMNEYAISPVPHSNVKGSDFAGKTFSLEWNLEVPYDGEYIFRGAADNEGKLYVDNKPLSIYHHNFRGPFVQDKVVLPEGNHNIRLDLFNTVERQIVQEQNFELSGGAVLEVEEWTDDDWQDIVCYVDEGKFTNINGGRCKFVVSASEAFPEGSQKEIDVRITTRAEFINNIEIVGLFNVTGPEIDTVGNKIQLNKRFKQTLEVGKVYDVIVKTLQGNSPATRMRTRSLPGKTLPIPASTGSNLRRRNVFNTVDYINKATRQLWRTNIFNRGGFINDFGVSPFDTAIQLEDNPYAGTHPIVWNNVEFPVDGNYIIEIEVDDSVNLKIGDQVSIRKEGFVDDDGDKPTGKYKEAHTIKKGIYTITADLEQIPGGKFGYSGIKGINPMALAINIETAFSEKEVDLQKSFNENPMGVALTIEAPLPSIPQQPLPQQEGRCPPNPIWSTRFPNADEKWHPVNFKGWSKYLNKYAMSPIPPLSTPNSDGGGGIPYRNKWTVEIPYEGFYKLKAEVDDIARLYVDGDLKLNLDRGAAGAKVGFKGENLFKLTPGNHQIEVEVENLKFERMKLIDQQIFNTANWLAGATAKTSLERTTVDMVYVDLNASNNPIAVENPQRIVYNDTGKSPALGGDINASFNILSGDGAFSADGKQITGQGSVTINLDWNDKPGTAGRALKSIIIGDKTWTITGARRGSVTQTVNLSGTVTASATTVKSGTVKSGVIYEGPELASYRSGPLGPELTPAWKNDEDYRQNNMDKTWEMTWKNVDFPKDAEYNLQAVADDVCIIHIDGVEVGKAIVNRGVAKFNFKVAKGKHEVKLILNNIPGLPTSTFATNPTVASVIITTRVKTGTGITKPWSVNPIGLSASLIPPPCPKKIEGKGVVTDVKVSDPGNGFNPPQGPGYPVLLELKNIDIEDSGINYDCAKDTVVIEPANGAELSLCGCDEFGRITQVCIDKPGSGWTEFPDITVQTDTGINATLQPQFKIVRDPIVPPEKLIQVTDLVGVKQTGYYDGRPYYGAVFYKEGIKYAGYYETVGPLTQIYDTLQESIDAEVTTPASAILRQGTDISSNDPRLNIPGSPENLTDN